MLSHLKSAHISQERDFQYTLTLGLTKEKLGIRGKVPDHTFSMVKIFYTFSWPIQKCQSKSELKQWSIFTGLSELQASASSFCVRTSTIRRTQGGFFRWRFLGLRAQILKCSDCHCCPCECDSVTACLLQAPLLHSPSPLTQVFLSIDSSSPIQMCLDLWSPEKCLKAVFDCSSRLS